MEKRNLGKNNVKKTDNMVPSNNFKEKYNTFTICKDKNHKYT